jgi:VanZ family protein
MLRLILAFSWLIIICVAMLTPGDKFPDANYFNLQDKLIHLICFAGLSFLWCGVGIKKSELPKGKNRLILNFILFGLVAGIGLEYAQRFIPYRTFDFMDMIVNEIGGILGLLGYFKIPTTSFHLE